MKLGNSNGNNRGKTYFVRGRDDLNITVFYAEAADHFTQWFEKNYNRLKQQLISKGGFDDDVFNETYLRVYERILYTGEKVRDYACYFFRAFFTNHIGGLCKENRYCELYENYDVEEYSGLSFAEIEAKQERLENDIMDYVYTGYDIREFEIFKMYVTLKPAVNYHSLAKMTGGKYHIIQRIISRIIKDVKENADFSKRRRELISA